jgi:hypothetical protein
LLTADQQADQSQIETLSSYAAPCLKPCLETEVIAAVRDAARDEIDLRATVWTVPAEWMTAGREHRIPLSSRPWRLCGSSTSGGPVCLAGQEPRSHCRLDRAGETTNCACEVIVMARAHQLKDKAEAA